MAKINLSDLQGMLSKRGREAYNDPTLEAEIASLDPKVEGDAFIWDDARVIQTMRITLITRLSIVVVLKLSQSVRMSLCPFNGLQTGVA
jgi:hypothetical protein